MLDALLALTDTGEFEDAGGFRLHGLQQNDNALALTLRVDLGDESPDRLRLSHGAPRDQPT